MKLRAFAILGVIAAVVAATTAAVNSDDESNVTVTAMFTDVSPMVPGNVVKASGVRVGEIKDIQLDDGVARVTMDVERSVLPLHSDASATIITQDLLGERFVALDRGTASAPELAAGSVIDQKHTRRVVDLDQVLNAVDDPTGTAFAALLTTLGEGMAGNGEQVADAIKALAPAMRDAKELSSILNDQNALLARLVGNAEPVATAVAGERGESLDRLVDTSTTALSAIAADRQAVEAALRELPSTLASARRTLARVAGVSDSTAGTLASLRPVTGNLTDISRELHAYAKVADPALAALPPVLRRGNRLLDEAAPLAAALRAAGPELRSSMKSTRYLLQNGVTKQLTHLMEFVKGWSLATSDYDAISHYFKAIVPVSPKVSGQVGVGPVPGGKSPVPDTPLPDSPSLPLPGRDENGDQPLLPSPDTTPDSATGLTREQENSMLHQMLGGL